MTDEQRLATITEYFKNKYPETIFNHDIKLNELKRFGGLRSFEKDIEYNADYYSKTDNAFYQLGILMSMRGDTQKAKQYFAKIKNRSLLSTLVNDF